MSYTVDWTPEARSQLAAIWIHQVSRRQDITAAQATIDRLLAADPVGNGRHLSEGLFAIDEYPLQARFEIADADRFVIVVSVHGWP